MVPPRSQRRATRCVVSSPCVSAALHCNVYLTPLCFFFGHLNGRRPTTQVISEVKGRGLKVDVEYARIGSQHGNGYVYMQLVLTNTKSHTLCNIAMEVPTKLAAGMDVKPFASISMIAPGSSMLANLHVNFGGKAQTAKFKISFDDGEIVTVPLKPLLGELLVPLALSDAAFISAQKGLSGLQEASCTVDVAEDTNAAQILASALNAARVVDGALLLVLACSSICSLSLSLSRLSRLSLVSLVSLVSLARARARASPNAHKARAHLPSPRTATHLRAPAPDGIFRFSATMCGSVKKVLCSFEPASDGGASAKLRCNSENAMLASGLCSLLKKLF